MWQHQRELGGMSFSGGPSGYGEIRDYGGSGGTRTSDGHEGTLLYNKKGRVTN